MKKKTSKEKLEFKQKLKEKRRERRELTKEAFAKNLLTTTKQLIWWFAINGTIWIYSQIIHKLLNHFPVTYVQSLLVLLSSMSFLKRLKTFSSITNSEEDQTLMH